MMHNLVLLGILVAIQALIYNLASAISCLICNLKIQRFTLFFGKPLVTFQTRLFPVTIGCLPSGGYVSYDQDDFCKRPLLVRLLITLSGPLVTLLTACLLLGFTDAVHQFITGFPEIFRGAFSPFDRGVPLIREFFRVADESVFIAYGILAAKFTALNLLPFPSLVGGRIVREIVGREREFRFPDFLSAIVSFVILPLLLSWAIALISYFRHM